LRPRKAAAQLLRQRGAAIDLLDRQASLLPMVPALQPGNVPPKPAFLDQETFSHGLLPDSATFLHQESGRIRKVVLGWVKMSAC
jgi:hypothetical protein